MDELPPIPPSLRITTEDRFRSMVQSWWYTAPPAIMLAVVVITHPRDYGVYIVLRFFICIMGAFLAATAWMAKRWTCVVPMVAATIIFNPFIPFHFHRHTWVVVDLLTMLMFLAYGFFFPKEFTPESLSSPRGSDE